MADNSVSITSSYVGEAAAEFVKPAVLSANSLINGYVTVAENVKKSLKIQRISGTDIQAYVCEPWSNTDDAIVLDEVELVPLPLMFPMELCKSDYRDTWMALNTGKGFANQMVPPEFVKGLLDYASSRNEEAVEKNIWQGNFNSATSATTGTGVVTNFDGIIRKCVAGTASMGGEHTYVGPMTGDADNTTGVITLLTQLLGDAPDAIQGDIDTKIFMSRKTLALYQLAMAGVVSSSGGYSPTFVGESRPTQYLGYDIIVPQGFPNDTLLIGQIGNLWFGTDMTSDILQASVVDMTPTTNEDLLRIKYVYTGGCQVGWLGDLGIVRRSS